MSDLSIMIGNIPLRVVDNGNGTFSIASVINAAIPAGTHLIGKVDIDQTVDGATNRVVAKISQENNENIVEITNFDITLSALRDAITKTGETSKTLADLAAQLGEVQANPTTNTLLARLKDLLTGIALAAGPNLIGKVGIDQATDGTTNRVVSKISPITGENVISFGDTAQPVSIVGSYTKDYFSGSSTVTKDYSANPMSGFDISNDGANDLEISVNGMTFTYKAGETDSRNFVSFTVLTITATTAFRCWIRG